MPIDRNDSTPQDGKSRRRFEAETISRQSNVLPLDAARNEGQFYGQLIRGDRPLTGVQRIGFFLIGFIFSAWAALMFLGAFPRLAGAVGLRFPFADGKSISLLYLPIAAISLFIGVKIIRTAVMPRGHRHSI